MSCSSFRKLYLFFAAIVLTIFRISSAELPYPEGDQRNYYIYNLITKPDYFLNDKKKKKTVWRRKVSHLVLETVEDRHRVTLLMMERYPYNYKGQNYPIYYEYRNFEQAMQKYIRLDKFLSASGVMRVKIHGSLITDEKILFPGYVEKIN